MSSVAPSRTILSNESILSQASDHSATRDIRSAVFPVTIDKTGFSSLGFHVVVRFRFSFIEFFRILLYFYNQGGLDSEIEDHGIYVKSITNGGAAARSNLLKEGLRNFISESISF